MLRQKRNDEEEAKGNYMVQLDQTNTVQREHYSRAMPAVFDVCFMYSRDVWSGMICMLICVAITENGREAH